MLSKMIKTDTKTYHTVCSHKKVAGLDLPSFDINIQFSDQKTWKTYKALLDIDSNVSLCLTGCQAEALLLLPSTQVSFYGEKRSILGQATDIDTLSKCEYPLAVSIEVFLPNKEAEKKEFSNYCSVMHVIYDDDVPKFDYHPENNEVLVGRQFFNYMCIDLEDKDVPDCQLAFSFHTHQELPDWTPKV